MSAQQRMITPSETEHTGAIHSWYAVLDEDKKMIGEPTPNYSLAEERANKWLEESVGVVYIVKSFVRIEHSVKKSITHYK